MFDQKGQASGSFRSLAFLTAILTFGLIIFGAVVRVTDSGLGCGSSWPLCDGTILPPLDNLTAWIEWSHRLFALLIGILGLSLLWNVFRHNAGNRLAVIAVIVAAVLYLVQSALGALVVIFELPPATVSLHLGTAMLLLAAFIIAYVVVIYQPKHFHEADQVTSLSYITTALSLVIILSGALVRGRGATLACVDWPLCNGELFPFSQGDAAITHMLHRFAVVGLGLCLLLLVWQVFQNRRGGAVRIFVIASLVMYLVQSLVGAFFVWASAAPEWGVLHVTLASLTWAMLVVVSVIEYLSSRKLSDQRDGTLWTSQSEAILN
jgi:heme A synthase